MNTKHHELPNGFKIVTKKLFAFILGFCILTSNVTLLAQTKTEPTASTTAADSGQVNEDEDATLAAETPEAPIEAKAEKPSGHQVIKNKFIEGDPVWMSPVLICLLIGLAIIIERIISLFLMGINTQKFVERVENLLKTKGVEAAKEECRNTKGPIASIYYQGLDRVDEGIDKVEAAVQSYGSVQMGQLEKGMVWISLFIALAPMLGFLGTVIGMIAAFDMIAAAGDISPTIVASGIKIALLTTVAGLIVAIILQIFYNLILSKIDSIANEMEDASISLTDMLIKNKITK
ncbi:MAG: MotA/TolQ/ExbB proton channel family protein [Candidatus Paceibacterota bacterium]